MLKNDGVPTPEELSAVLPPPERLAKGPVVVVECFQDIPCDPCVSACPSHAITMKEGITDKPHVDFNKCTGCKLCVPKCPGLAIFVVDMTYSKNTATVSVPHELLPVPKVGEVVAALDRVGKVVGEAKVVSIMSGKKFDKTHTITVEVPKEQAMNVRAIKVLKGKSL